MARDDTIVGLDIGRYSAKAAWVKHGGGGRITRVEILRFPPDTSDPRRIVAPWIEQLKLAEYPCVIGIPGQQCMFQPFLLPPGDPRTTEQAASMEVIRFNEMASEQMTYGFVPISVNPGERRLILGMARPSVIDELLASAKGMGLNVVDVAPLPVALFNAGEALEERHAPPYLYVNIGFTTTDIAVGSASGPLFARSFSGGGQMFTEELARTRGVSPGQAENLKLAGGIAWPEVKSAAEQWMAELRSCLSVYDNLYSGHKMRPARIVLAGGAAQLGGLPEYVADQFKTETRLVQALPGNPPVKNPSSFMVAAGLALGGLDGGAGVRLSLLPQQMRNDIILRRQKAYWIAAGLAAALILAVSLVGGFRDVTSKKAHLDAQNVSLKKRQELGARLKTIEAENARMQQMVAPVRKLLRGAPLMRNLICMVANSLAPSDQITMVCDADFYFLASDAVSPPPTRAGMRDRRRAPPPQEKKIDEGGFERLIIEGYTRTPNLSTVKDLIAKLGKSESVASADLLSDDQLLAESQSEATPKDAGLRRFVIDVKLRSP